MSKTVLVTGGAGFVGSHIVEALLAQGFSVRVVDDFSSGSRSFLDRFQGRIEFVEGDIADEYICRVACSDVEFVFHEAGRASVVASIEDPFQTQRSGEIAMLHLLKAAAERGVRRIVFAASSSAYGDSKNVPYSESMQPCPMSPYAASKLACEHYLAAYCKCFGIDGVSLRYFNVFGKGQRSDGPYSGVVAKFLEEMRAGREPVICGDGEQTRDFVYIDNVVEANLLAMRCEIPLEGMALNIGCGEQISINMLVAMLNWALGTKLEPLFEASRIGDPRRSFADISLARRVLGYDPKIDFSEGIKRLVSSS